MDWSAERREIRKPRECHDLTSLPDVAATSISITGSKNLPEGRKREVEGKRQTGQERNTTDKSKLLPRKILLSSCSLRERILGEVRSALPFSTVGFFFLYPYEKKNLLIAYDKQNVISFS